MIKGITMDNIAKGLFQKLYKQYFGKNHNYEYSYYLDSVKNNGANLFGVPEVFLTNEMIMTAIETSNSPIYLMTRMEFERKYMQKYESSMFKDDLKDFTLENLEELIELQYDEYILHNHALSEKKYYTFFDFFRAVAKYYSGMDTICYVYLYRGYPIPISIKNNKKKKYYMLIYAVKNRTLNLVNITYKAYKNLWLNLSVKLDEYYKESYHLGEYCWEEKPSDLMEIHILPEGSFYDSFTTIEKDGAIYDMPLNNILSITGDIEEFVIPEGVCSIAPGCFKGNKKLKKITIPSSLKDIPEAAFMDCTSLENVDLSAVKGGLSLYRVSVHSAAFCNCCSLKSIDMSKIEIVSGDIVFACTGIESIVGIKRGLMDNCAMTFYHCSYLKELPDEEYDSFADYGEFGLACCTSLTKVHMCCQLDIPQGVLYGCTNLEDVSFKDDNYIKILINPYAFAGCGKIKRIDFPKASVVIFKNAFQDCRSLSLLTLSKADEWNSSIDPNAFIGSENVKISWVEKKAYKSPYSPC